MSDELLPSVDNAPPSVPAAADAPPHRSNLLREIIETALLTAIIFLIVNTATGRFRIEGQSMEPNLHEGEYVLIDKVSYLLHPPERGDIIVFTQPGRPDLIKRIIGLPGDTIEARAGQVYVNGTAIEEPYLKQPTANVVARVVEPGHYFVMGDNRGNSSDSRVIGAIAASSIVGRAWIVYWPPADWGAVPHYAYAALKK